MATYAEELLVLLGFDTDTSGANQFTGAMDGVVGKAMAVASIIGGLFTANALFEASDRAQLMSDRLKDLTGSAEDAANMQDRLYDASQRLGASQQDMAESAARTLPILKDMGKGTDEAIKMAEVLMTTARLNGSSTAEAAASAQQFAQAIGSGVLQGDELKSILENNNTLARIVSDGMGVTIGELKDLGAEGKITSKTLVDIIMKSYDQVRARSKDLKNTFGQERQRFNNWYDNTVKKLNDEGVFDPFINAMERTRLKMEQLTTSGRVKQFAENISAAMDHITGITERIGKWADESGVAENATAALGFAVAYLGIALGGLAIGGTVWALFGLFSMLFSPLMLVGFAIGIIALAIDDLRTYSNGGDSVIGRLIEQYPAVATAKDVIVESLQFIQDHAELLTWAMGVLTTAIIWYKKQAIISFIATRVMAIASFAMMAASALAAGLSMFASFVMAFAPVLLVVAVIAAIVYAIWWLYSNWDQVWSFISTLVGVTVDAIKAKWDEFTGFFTSLGDKIKGVWDTVVNWIRDKFAAAIPDWLKNLLNKGAKIALDITGKVPEITGATAANPAARTRGAAPASQTVNNSVTINTPTPAAAGAAARAYNSGSARQTYRKATSGSVKQ